MKLKSVKKMLWLLFCSVLAALLLLSSVMIVASQLLNVAVVRENIIARLSAGLGARLSYQRAEVRIFPRPRAVIYQTRLEVPERLNGVLDQITAIPQILPLLNGRVRFSRIDFHAPRFQLTAKPPDGSPGKAAAEAAIRRVIAAVAMHPMMETAGLSVRIISGRLDIGNPDGPAYHFDNINARIRRTVGRIHLKVASGSDLWEQLILVGQIKPSTVQGYATLQIKAFKPHRLPAGLHFEPLGMHLTRARLDLNVNIDADSPGRLKIDLKAVDPEFHLQCRGKKVVLAGKRVEAVIRSDAQTWMAGVSVLELDRPQLRLSGNFLLNRVRPEFNLEVSAVGVHVDPVRETAMALAGGNPAVRDIFEVIRGGRVPVVSVSARGRTLRDLNDIDAYLIKGRMSDGRIYIPGAALNLTEVRGQATIADGLLRGDQLHARLDASHGSDGTLLLGLKGDADPFHLEIQTHADVARLQPVLLRLVGGEKFQQELTRIHRISGRAVGRLILGESLDAIQVTTVVSNAELRAEYGRIPFPIEITGGRYIINKTTLAVEHVRARIGGSLFSDLSMDFGWRADADLHVRVRNSHVKLMEFNTWLSTLEDFRPFQDHFSVYGGTAHIDSFELHGPLRNTKDWRFTSTGRMEKFELRTPHLSKSLAIGESRFDLRVDGNRNSNIRLSETRMQWHDSSLDLGGTINLSSRGIEVDLQVNLDRLAWQRIRELMTAGDTFRRRSRSEGGRLKTFAGTLSVAVDRLEIDRWTLSPVEARLNLSAGKVFVDVIQAEICGISVPGVLMATPPALMFNFQPQSAGGSAAATLACFGGSRELLTGTFDLSGELHVDVVEKSLLESLQGRLAVDIRSGRIYRYGVLAKILAVLNVTEIFKGKVPDIAGSGFAYESVKINGHLERGTFVLDEALIDAASMTVGYTGRIDLVEQTLDLTVLVAPFKTIDSIIESIPLIDDLFGGQLISIPFKVQGGWSDFDVQPLAVSQADTGLLGMINKVLRMPSRLFQPMLPKKMPAADTADGDEKEGAAMRSSPQDDRQQPLEENADLRDPEDAARRQQ